MNCIFCKIIAGEVESSKVYEDDHILAFMDLHPVNEGQVLVIPKEHIDHFSDIPEDLATEIFIKAHRISRKIRETLHPERMGFAVHGYGVSHAHFIIIPQRCSTDITNSKMAKIKNGKIIFTADNLPAIPRAELNRVSEVIKNGLVV
jgi:histidine triad (HIT) family protein